MTAPLSGLLLAGGKSRRMGTDKAELVVSEGLSLREIIGIFNANRGAPLGGEDDGDVIRFDEDLFDPVPPVVTLNSVAEDAGVE